MNDGLNRGLLLTTLLHTAQVVLWIDVICYDSLPFVQHMINAASHHGQITALHSVDRNIHAGRHHHAYEK
jgi:imidazoleglycerol phosphate dehydratase HisB